MKRRGIIRRIGKFAVLFAELGRSRYYSPNWEGRGIMRQIRKVAVLFAELGRSRYYSPNLEGRCNIRRIVEGRGIIR